MANESYVGVSGEMREISYVKVGASGVRHVIAAYAGVDGEVRLVPGLCKIDHVCFRLTHARVADGDGNEASISFSGGGNSIAILSDDGGTVYGHILVTESTRSNGEPQYEIEVGTDVSVWQLAVTFTMLAVYPDGCEVEFGALYDKTGLYCGYGLQVEGYYGGGTCVVGSLSEEVLHEAKHGGTTMSSCSTEKDGGGLILAAYNEDADGEGLFSIRIYSPDVYSSSDSVVGYVGVGSTSFTIDLDSLDLSAT